MNSRLRKRTNLLLAALVLLDIVLSGTCLLFPAVWFRWFHGAPYIDPQALLRRTGAVWAAFTLLQLIAFFRWQKFPHWLVLIAGVRLTEIFSDWTYLALCSTITCFGRAALLISPPANLVFGLILLKTWERVAGAASAPR
jgi:hypothetical protein